MSYLYTFGSFVLDSRKRRLSRADSPVFLTPKAFDVLLFLVQNPNRLVTKEELLQAVWADTFVEEGNLKYYISQLRKALGDNSEDTRLIVTIARKGYHFTAPVIVAEDSQAREVAIPVLTAASLPVDARQVQELVIPEEVPKQRWRWWKTVTVGASVVIFTVVGFVSLRQFSAMARPRSAKIMLAVLPFKNLTGDPDKEYLADGLTEETISQLGRLDPNQLDVIARTSVMGYKLKNERLDQIGRDLSVQYVLENSLRQSGDHLRITSQLVQVNDQSHLWSHDFDYRAQDILTIQDDVATAVAREIQLRLTSRQQAELAQPHLPKPEAFDAYLRGYFFFERNTDKDTEMAAKSYELATQLDPSYPLAWVGLSRVRKWQASRGLIPTEEGYRLAREEVERALALNPNLAAAHTQMYRIKQQLDFDWAGADASAQKAVELEPGNPEAVMAAGMSAAILGRFDEALRLTRHAVDLDPLNADSWDRLGEAELFAGQLDEAAAHGRKALELNPDVFPGRSLFSQIYVLQGRPQDALPEIKLVRDESSRLLLYAIAYHALGRQNDSDAALNELMTKYPHNTYHIAEIYAFWNQPDAAFESLSRAYAQRNAGLIATKVDPLLKTLHRDRRFAALLKKLNFPT
jgi:TolB-like protein/DNA-binding winged helix-turn-helix (wHTH) protein/Flp pilus assembly protein TadD